MTKLKKALPEDLEKLSMLFNMVAGDMRRNNVYVWRENYPFEHLETDIAAGHLWVMTREDNMILAAFSMHEDKNGAEGISWSDPAAKAMYIERFGVYPYGSLRQNLVFETLHKAARAARDMGARYLRILELHGNTPAMISYLHSGFRHMEGDMSERIDEQNSLWLHGFEMKI